MIECFCYKLDYGKATVITAIFANGQTLFFLHFVVLI